MMKTLCMDSAHRHLVIVLLEDGIVKAGTALSCWKQQSETLFPELIRCMDSIGWGADDLDEVFITDGPGSYTGVRIAMAVAKVLCTRKHIPLYCISTLQLYAGLKKDVFVMLDARSSRAYAGSLSNGSFVKEECIMTLDEIKAYLQAHPELNVFGDADLIGLEVQKVDFIENFAQLRSLARCIEHPHTLTPRYLKEQDAYKVN